MKKVKQCQETSQGIKKLESARNDTGGILETKQPTEVSQLLSLEDNDELCSSVLVFITTIQQEL